ncbi:MAG: BON domain-containing protein [Sulfuriferula sp.]
MRRVLMFVTAGMMVLQLQACVPLVAAGAGAGAAMAIDRRSSGAYIDDKEIELRVANHIETAYPSDYVHVDVMSFNRSVLLTGEVPDAQTQQKIADIAHSVMDVTHVYDETKIKPPTTLTIRTSDAYLTTAVKTRFLDAKRFPVSAVKVTTEDGVVYLMGFVTQQEGQDAAQIASTTSGVIGVVKLFEYIDKAP